MNRKTNNLVKHYFYAIEIFIMYFLQSSPNLILKIFAASPMLICATVIIISIIEKGSSPIFLGLFAGILMDISFGKYFGLFSLIMPILCSLISFFINSEITIFKAMRFSSVSVFLVIILDWLFRYCLAGYSAIFLVFIDKYLPICFYTILCLPILYLLNLGVFLGMRYTKGVQN